MLQRLEKLRKMIASKCQDGSINLKHTMTLLGKQLEHMKVVREYTKQVTEFH